ncbi:hypothetical protein [Tenacibaculum larymnensis]|uniref:Uncharacterized protein n=1 Tax=Tenacibaculum larymnensis TaxID=2878201 RepID=A0A9X4IQY3_9FLAO|nr:hypothetical protein [Tenacibaculum larymnensis]MDE1207671.1 hypothetical protein [Tenacibaculum larymnensis]
MKTHHKIVCIWFLLFTIIQTSNSQNSSKAFEEKELARMSINTSRIITEDENVGDIFQNYINQIQKASIDLGMDDFEFDSKSFSLYKEEDSGCLHLSIELSMMFHYDSKKVNALSKALHTTKNKTWAIAMYLYMNN